MSTCSTHHPFGFQLTSLGSSKHRQSHEIITSYRLPKSRRGFFSGLDPQRNEPISCHSQHLYLKQLRERNNKNRTVQRRWTTHLDTSWFILQKHVLQWTSHVPNYGKYHDHSHLSSLYEIQTSLFASKNNNIFVIRPNKSF